MSLNKIQLNMAAVIALILFFMGISTPVRAGQNSDEIFDAIIKISDLDRTLNSIDKLIGSDPNNPLGSPTSQLKMMIQGTEWIDPNRSIVIGVVYKGSETEMTALIPFQKPNEQFQMAYQAKAGPDYYSLALPPGRGTFVSAEMEKELSDESTRKSEDSIGLKIAVNQLIRKSDAQIKNGLDQIDKIPMNQMPQMGPEPKETKEMFVNMLKVAEQLKTMNIGLDFSDDEIKYTLDAMALPESRLAKLFTKETTAILLNNYKVNYQINFRSCSYNISGILDLYNQVFGKIYKTMGIDFASISAVCNSLTGEMVCGMSFNKGDNVFESISVLKDLSTAEKFLESVYIPWMLKYSKDMREILEKELKQEFGPIFIRTDDSVINGHKVFGVKFQIPLFMGQEDSLPASHEKSVFAINSRMTIVKNLLLTAPTDQRLKELIKVSEGLKQEPFQGPLMTGDIDISDYFNTIKEMVPGLSANGKSFPKMGKMTFTADIKDGGAYSSTSMKVEDIKKMVAFFKDMPLASLQPGQSQTTMGYPQTPSKMESESKDKSDSEQKSQDEPKEKQKTTISEKAPETAEPIVIKKDAVYWFNQGTLSAVYGYNKDALDFYNKAIELDPQNSTYYFQQGIAYGDMGKFHRSNELITRAIEMRPEKGKYYYGRGRVFLLSGQKDRAFEDFKKAATLGDAEAISYMERMKQ